MADKQSHSAAEAALGYLYQCRYALTSLLDRARSRPDVTVSLETRDDIVFEDGTSKELLQTKHHVRSPGNLADSSVDLWKTLRIWSAQEQLEPPDLYFLITTQTLGSGSISERLSVGAERDIDVALALLQSVAIGSRSQENASAYEAFRSLGPELQRQLLSRIHIFGVEPSIAELPARLSEHLAYAALPQHMAAFLERFEGWWFRRCIDQLTGVRSSPISGLELHAKLEDLRGQFQVDNLPIDDDLFSLTPNSSDFSHKTFVRQLLLIDAGDKRVSFAIRDFMRAFTQRSRWLREDLIVVDELDKYERRLIEEWERHFEEMKESLGDAMADDAKITAARKLYAWVEQEALIPIRPRCDEPFVTRGTYQQLAERQQVGWHVDYIARLMGALEPEASE